MTPKSENRERDQRVTLESGTWECRQRVIPKIDTREWHQRKTLKSTREWHKKVTLESDTRERL